MLFRRNRRKPKRGDNAMADRPRDRKAGTGAHCPPGQKKPGERLDKAFDDARTLAPGDAGQYTPPKGGLTGDT